MTENCKEKLLQISRIGTKMNARIGQQLIEMSENESKKIYRVTMMSSIFGISNSSVTRFIQKLGYPSFKHFEYEYNSEIEQGDNKDSFRIKKSEDVINYYNLAKEIRHFVKDPKEVFIIPSKNANIIGTFLKERLEKQGLIVHVFNGASSEVADFIKLSAGSPLFLITISGYSNIFSKAIEVLSEEKNPKNKVIILSVNNVFRVFEKYEYIYVLTTNNSKDKYLFDSWSDYNFRILEIFSLLTNILNYSFI